MMTRTMKVLLMIFSASNKGGRGARPGFFPLILTALLFPVTGLTASLGPDISVPSRDTLILKMSDDAIAASPSPATTEDLSAQALAQQVRAHIERSRATGSPRPLGLAQGLLDQVPEQRWTPEVYLMRATLRQRLHRFDEAEADLSRVLQAEPNNAQAWLTRYSIALVRGDIATASRACSELAESMAGLLAESCTQEVASLGEQPEEAFRQLRQAVDAARSASAVERDYALVTLADIASRLNLPSAGDYWQQSLLSDPGDLYRRARYADWLLSNDQPDKALQITQGYEEIDTLAVLRAIALKRLDDPKQQALSEILDERFAEARWRGEFLHEWEYARYLLDVQNDSEGALEMARANWETQRAYPDRELLIRAAQAAGDQQVLQDLGIDNREAQPL